MSDIKKYVAELVGSLVLVLIGVGTLTTLFASPAVNSGLVGVGFAFAIAVIAMVYAIGPISGCHINPAVTIGLLAIKAISVKDAAMYVIFQIIGAVIAGAMLWMFYTDFGNNTDAIGALMENASNGYPTTGNGMITIFILEVILAFVLQLVILGSLNNKGWSTNAGIAIGLTVAALIFLAGPLDNAGINPIRAIAPAVFSSGGNALEQLWLFIVAPIVGGIVGSFTWKWLGKADAA